MKVRAYCCKYAPRFPDLLRKHSFVLTHAKFSGRARRCRYGLRKSCLSKLRTCWHIVVWDLESDKHRIWLHWTQGALENPFAAYLTAASSRMSVICPVMKIVTHACLTFMWALDPNNKQRNNSSTSMSDSKTHTIDSAVTEMLPSFGILHTD
jgi:hypothetical protein